MKFGEVCEEFSCILLRATSVRSCDAPPLAIHEEIRVYFYGFCSQTLHIIESQPRNHVHTKSCAITEHFIKTVSYLHFKYGVQLRNVQDTKIVQKLVHLQSPLLNQSLLIR